LTCDIDNRHDPRRCNPNEVSSTNGDEPSAEAHASKARRD